MSGSTSGLQAFHLKYSAANELGCPIGQATTLTSSTPSSGFAFFASVPLAFGLGAWRRRRR
jgi:hypothetical protein